MQAKKWELAGSRPSDEVGNWSAERNWSWEIDFCIWKKGIDFEFWSRTRLPMVGELLPWDDGETLKKNKRSSDS